MKNLVAVSLWVCYGFVTCFPAGIKKIHETPDIFLIDDLLTDEECASMIQAASKKEMKVGPQPSTLLFFTHTNV
jgi:hypothetical protein